MTANITKKNTKEEVSRNSTGTTKTTTTHEKDPQMEMARKIAEYLGEEQETKGYRTFDTDQLPSFFQMLLRGPTEVMSVAAEDVRSGDVDHLIKEIFEGGDVLNWWTPQVQLLLPVCDGESDDNVDHRSRPGLNKSRLNSSLQYLRTHINIIFEGKYFMKVNHKVQQVNHHHQRHNEDVVASNCYYQERLTSQEVSIFTLSNILRQPIVVLSKGRTRDSVGGIYLPLRVAPSDCKKWPLVIGYHLGTYYPLIAVHDEDHFDREFLLPLVYSDLKPFVVKCSSFVNTDNFKDVLTSYVDTVTYQNDRLVPICAAQLLCPAVKRTIKSMSAAQEFHSSIKGQSAATLTGDSRTLVSKHIERELWTTPYWNNRDLLVTRCLAEGCDHAASLVSKHPLCANCEASMKRKGVIQIGLMSTTNTTVRPLSRTRTNGQHNSFCRCPCGGKNGGSVSSSDEEYSESDENPNEENLNDLNALNGEFRHVDARYMNLPIDYGIRI